MFCETSCSSTVLTFPDQINKLPTSDQTDPLQLKKGVSNLAGGATQNPLGEATGEAADNLTSPFTGR